MISIVIPAYNEEKNIAACLSALVDQKTSEKFEVIVVDNNSTDKTIKVVKNFSNKLNLRIVSEATKGRGAARKKGFDEAGANIIFSTDADAIVPKEWIETLRHKFHDTQTTAVTGIGYINDRSTLINALFNFIQPAAMKLYRLTFGHYWLTGFNFAIRKNVYHKAGGFDKNLNIQEDIDLSFKVSKITKIVFVENCPVLVSGRRYEKGLVRGLFPYMSTFIHYFFLKDKKVILSDVR